jgi:hypothetical protein
MSPWKTYTPDTPMPEEVRRRREQERGQLIGTFTVQVYERDTVPWVGFQTQVSDDDLTRLAAELVNRAKETLADWR